MSSLELDSSSKSANRENSEYKYRLKSTLQDTRYAYQLGKDSQSARLCFKYKPYSYKPEDLQWINRTVFKETY